MQTATLAETQALAEMADLLYSFLPGSGAMYTWREAAAEHGLEHFWGGGSKLPAITQLLEATFERRRDRFCDLLLTAVKQGMKYRIKKGEPVTREEVQKLNALVRQVGFGIPGLLDRKFLDGLPSKTPPSSAEAVAPAHRPPDPQAEARKKLAEEMERLRQRFLVLLAEKNTQARGYAFEAFLNDLFRVNGLAPREPFRVVGEQIDGSFEWQSHVFLLEARWRQGVADAPDLYVLRGKVEGKSDWTRGLFISVNGFSSLAADTFSKGRRANLITMDGQDLMLILEQRCSLQDAVRVKLRHAGETGEVYLPLANAGL
jgi:hypothetical protein